MPYATSIPHLETASVGRPINRLGVSLFPIYLRGNELPEIVTGDDADCKIGELDDPTVPALCVHNRGKQPALLVEGEHLVGGKQNRTINVTVLVPAETRLEIPVSCLEQGRWGRSRRYRRHQSFTPARVRSVNQQHVYASMRRHGSRRGNQGAVWAKVDGLLRDQGTRSATIAAAEADAIYERDRSRSDAVEELIQLGPLPGQCGVAVSNGWRVNAVEIFGAPHLLRAHWKAIVRSHLIEIGKPKGKPSPSAVLAMISRFAFLKTECTEGVGMGVECRGEDRRLTGQALTLESSLVHGAAFRKQEPEAEAW